MSLLSALNAATSGLRVTQAGIGVVSQNVANADTAGYTRRRLAPIQQLAGERTSGVRAGDIERVIDLVAQRQLRLETSGAAYTALNARFAADIDRLFGQPGSSSSLDGTVNAFAGALQTLASDPSSFRALRRARRGGVAREPHRRDRERHPRLAKRRREPYRRGGVARERASRRHRKPQRQGGDLRRAARRGAPRRARPARQ